MSETKKTPSTHDEYSSIWKLSSPNDKSNWDTWAFALGMMLRGKDLDYTTEGTVKDGCDTEENKLLEVDGCRDNRLVCFIIASRFHEENYPIIQPVSNNARRMYLALRSAHQNFSAGSRYMHLRSMMSEQATDTDDVSRLLGPMENLCNKLQNVCPEGTVTIDDVYISSVIAALPESWSAVTGPLELQLQSPWLSSQMCSVAIWSN